MDKKSSLSQLDVTLYDLEKKDLYYLSADLEVPQHLFSRINLAELHQDGIDLLKSDELTQMTGRNQHIFIGQDKDSDVTNDTEEMLNNLKRQIMKSRSIYG